MAREIRGVADSGTLYARILQTSTGYWWNGTTFEAYTAANYANYDVAMTEQGDSGVYVADFPSGITSGGTYEYYVHLQSGGSPAEGDVVAGTGKVDWTGTASITAATGAMTGADFYAYLLRKGLKRTDKSTEAYEAITDAIQEMRQRFAFDEAETEATSTDTISTLGDFKITNETNMGMLLGVILEDDDTGTPLEKKTKAQFDELYPSINVDSDRGYPQHYCVYGGSIYIGPAPDSTDYAYRLTYSRRAGTITSSTTGVPFSDLYRDMLAKLSLHFLYEGLEEFDKAGYYRTQFESLFALAERKERLNAGIGAFNQVYRDC